MSSLDRFVDRSASSSRDRATPPTGHVDVDVGQVFPIGSTGASWSPDGKQIAYVASLDGNVHIYTMRSDGTDVRRLTTDLGHDKKTRQRRLGTTERRASSRGRALRSCPRQLSTRNERRCSCSGMPLVAPLASRPAAPACRAGDAIAPSGPSVSVGACVPSLGDRPSGGNPLR